MEAEEISMPNLVHPASIVRRQGLLGGNEDIKVLSKYLQGGGNIKPLTNIKNPTGRLFSICKNIFEIIRLVNDNISNDKIVAYISLSKEDDCYDQITDADYIIFYNKFIPVLKDYTLISLSALLLTVVGLKDTMNILYRLINEINNYDY